MNKKKVYFDSSATVEPKKEVIDYAIDCMKKIWKNPNSVYSDAIYARNIIEEARSTVANHINAKPNEIVFCPSASAANTLAISGYINKNNCKDFFISNMEHSSIYDIELRNVKKHFIECNCDGIIELSSIDKINKSLISISAANSEIGTIQDINSLSKMAHSNGCVFHCDLTQYIPHFPVNVKEFDIDMATFSGHKFGGLRGCGVLYVKEGIKLSPLIFGHQENNLVGGTENIISIVSMAKAIELINYSKINKLYELRNYMMKKLLEINNNIYINGSIVNRLPNNINICIPKIEITSQQIVSIFDMYGFEISSGSACNSYSSTPSHVLKAIGLSDNDANHTIRITLSENNTLDEVDDFIKCLKSIIDMNS